MVAASRSLFVKVAQASPPASSDEMLKPNQREASWSADVRILRRLERVWGIVRRTGCGGIHGAVRRSPMSAPRHCSGGTGGWLLPRRW